MPRRPDARIGDGPEWGLKLLHRDAGNGRPKGASLVKVEALMQVQANPQPGLVHVKEFAQPCTEERHHGGITVGKAHRAIALCSLTGVQRRAGRQKRLPAEASEPASTLAVQGLDLRCLPPLQDIWFPPASAPPGTWGELHIPHPQGYRRPGDAQLGGDVGQGPAAGPELTSPTLGLDLSTVTHGLSDYRTGVR
jgi:hypothetical protein